jgi:hypothetical protein
MTRNMLSTTPHDIKKSKGCYDSRDFATKKVLNEFNSFFADFFEFKNRLG